MRALPFACLIAVLATSALAEDRYGPATNKGVGTALPAPVARLTWPGKVARATTEAEMEAPQPLVDGSLRRTSVYGAAPRPVAVATANAAPEVENAPWRRLTGITTAPRPTATPGDAASTADAPDSPPARPTTPVATPGTLPAAQGYPASTTARNSSTGDHAKYYSLHREYGETPDAIAVPEKSQVFLAGGPLNSGVGEGDADIDKAEGDGTGKTAAAKKARIAADWGSSTEK